MKKIISLPTLYIKFVLLLRRDFTFFPRNFVIQTMLRIYPCYCRSVLFALFSQNRSIAPLALLNHIHLIKLYKLTFFFKHRFLPFPILGDCFSSYMCGWGILTNFKSLNAFQKSSVHILQGVLKSLFIFCKCQFLGILIKSHRGNSSGFAGQKGTI